MSRFRDIGGLLDRIAWASLPPEILLKRSAAYIRERLLRGSIDYNTGSFDVIPQLPNFAVRSLVEKLAFAPEEAAMFETKLQHELMEQYLVAAKRLNRSVTTPSRKKEDRVQVAALATFGPFHTWWRGQNPHHQTFSHLRVYQPGVVVALLRTKSPTYSEHKLVYRVSGWPTHCVPLPVPPKNLNDAFVMLRLGKVATKGARLSIDWIGKSFVVNNYQAVPWDHR